MDVKDICAEFSSRGLFIARRAATLISTYLLKASDPQKSLDSIVDQVQSLQKSVVEPDDIKNIISSMKKSASPSYNIIAFESAFEIPRLVVDSTNRSVSIHEQQKSTLGSSEDKLSCLSDRYHILYSYLLSTSLFQSSSVQLSIGKMKKASLATISSLVSLQDDERECTILGFLDTDGDAFFLEDPSGRVRIEFSQPPPASQIFPIGCLVIVHGEFDESCVSVSLMGHPPAQTIEDFYRHFWNSPLDPFGWGLTSDARSELNAMLRSDHSSSLILTFSDVWIDVPSIVDKFSYALSIYDKSPPNIIVICGSLTSKQLGFDRYAEFKKLFSKFYSKVSVHTAICEQSKFVFVPSLTDPAAPAVYPRPALPKSAEEVFPNAVFMTNPCRMRFLDQTFVIFRDDLLKRLTGSSLFDVPDKNTYSSVLTAVLAQRHLCPMDFSHCPISWPNDCAMRLYPQPDVLILADSCVAWSEEEKGCVAFNPGQFGVHGTYAQYFPAEKKAAIKIV